MATSIIYGLNYVYSHQNGKSIIFDGQDGQKLTQKDLHSVQLKMIQSNKIPHLLPLSVENIDLNTKLHYDITSKSKVLSFFRNNSTTMSDYYQVLLSIIKTIEASGSYMLDQQNFVLDTDFIFVGENPSDVYLTYLPITNLEKAEQLTDDMKKLLTDIAGEVEGLQGNEFKSILSYIKKPSFSFSGLKKLLLELISLRSNINQVNIHNDVNTEHQFNSNHIGTQNPANIAGATVNQQIPNQESIEGVKGPKKVKQKVKKKLPALTSKEKTYMFAGSVLGLGITWKLFDMKSNSTMLAVCSVLTLIIIVGLFVYWKVWRPGVTPIETEISPKQTDNLVQQQQSNEQPKQSPIQYQDESIYNRNVFEAPQSEVASSIDTTLLGEPSEDTVLLEDESDLQMDNMQQEEQILPMFVKSNATGQEEEIIINTNNFLIGRNADSVNYAEEAVGVSRIHAEIVKIDATSYAMKDLGSKNGSKLKGNSMVPYKIYALNENDEIALGKAIYTFKWSNSQ